MNLRTDLQAVQGLMPSEVRLHLLGESCEQCGQYFGLSVQEVLLVEQDQEQDQAGVELVSLYLAFPAYSLYCHCCLRLAEGTAEPVPEGMPEAVVSERQLAQNMGLGHGLGSAEAAPSLSELLLEVNPGHELPQLTSGSAFALQELEWRFHQIVLQLEGMEEAFPVAEGQGASVMLLWLDWGWLL